MDDNRKEEQKSWKSALLRLMRYVSVATVTAVLLSVFVMSILIYGFDLRLAFLGIFIFSTVLFFVSIPIIVLWVYSFVKSVIRRTKTDRILLWFHIVDIVLIGALFIMANRPSQKCDAFVMAEYYESENGPWLRDITKRYKKLLPDSTLLHVDISYLEKRPAGILSDQDMKALEKELKAHNCTGIEVDNYSNRGYSVVNFRHQLMGGYSYLLFDKPLTESEKESLNQDPSLIVYNDTTVFRYDAPAFGDINFVGKEEFLKHK